MIDHRNSISMIFLARFCRCDKTGVRIILFFLMSFVFACSDPEFTLKPLESRINITILPLLSLATDYQNLDISMDSLAIISLKTDFVEAEEPIDWDAHVLMAYQNPFRASSIHERHNTTFYVTGEAERIAYEPIIEVKKYISAYGQWGLLGLATVQSTRDMAAFVQYRFKVKDSTGNSIDSFLVVGTSSGDPKTYSRSQLMREANYLAACQFANQLAYRLYKSRRISITGQRVKYDFPTERRRRYLSHMKKLVEGSNK